jgi:hypothetical protein
MAAFWGLLGFDAAVLLIGSAGVRGGHVTLRRKATPRKPKEQQP